MLSWEKYTKCMFNYLNPFFKGNFRGNFNFRNWIGAKWYGFTDPQSGISHYVWWAGKTPGGNDILEEREVHLVEEATAYNVSKDLPKSERIYVTVRAYNKAGNPYSKLFVLP